MKTIFKHFFRLSVAVFAATNSDAQSNSDIVWATNAHSEIVSGVAFSADSTRVCSGSPDHYWNVWTVPSGALVRAQYLLNESISSIALSSNGTLLVTGTDDAHIRMRQVSDGTIQWQNAPGDQIINSISFSHDDARVVDARSNFGQLIVHNAGNGLGVVLEGGSETSGIQSAAFAPDDTLVASADGDRTAKLWRVSDQALLQTFIGHSNALGSVDFSPDGRLLATAGADGTARIWNVTNAEQLIVMDGGGGTAKFTADGKYLFTLNDGTFKVWRVSTGAGVGSITNTGATTFDIAKNGKYFAYGTGSGAVVLARMPVVLDSITRTGNQTILHWQGGTGLYQLQSRTNLSVGSWENIGTTTTNTVATNVNSSTLFFRVQSLPQP